MSLFNFKDWLIHQTLPRFFFFENAYGFKEDEQYGFEIYFLNQRKRVTFFCQVHKVFLPRKKQATY